MASAVVAFFLQKLGDQLTQEWQLLQGVREDVEWIKGEVEAMMVFLKDADDAIERSHMFHQQPSFYAGLQAWVAQVRHLVFDADDAIDEYMIHMEMIHRHPSRFKSNLACFMNLWSAKHHFGIQVQSIRKEVKNVKERRDLFQLPDHFRTLSNGGTNTFVGARVGHGGASPFVEEPDIVGVESGALQIQGWIYDEREQRIVISIIGMGGLGKTTLAKKVYNRIKKHFNCHGWVFVSQSFAVKDILKRIVKAYCKGKDMDVNDLEKMDEAALREKIYCFLQGKSYALVLDDIPQPDVWDEIKHAFPLDHSKGRIIFTTRSEDVASPLNENCYIYKLKPLPHDLACELFCRKAFKKKFSKQGIPPHLCEMIDAMVNKCNGLPLAIVVLGGLMSKKSVDEWKDVLKNFDWELKNDHDLKGLKRVLVTSYNYLPSHLKNCFLYCALFPEDYEIKKKKLIHLWVAEGFVEKHPWKAMEDVAHDYFMQLIDRSLLQPATSDNNGQLIACRMHDLMRDVAICMFEENDFGTVLANQWDKVGRRMAIHSEVTGTLPSEVKFNSRTLLLFNIRELSRPFLQMVLKFKLLRVLDLRNARVRILPEEVGNLLHLRYLGLRGTQIRKLPAQLQKLRFLQTLDIRDTKVKILPSGITILPKLKHLLLRNMKLFNEHDLVKVDSRKINSGLQTLTGAVGTKHLLKKLSLLTGLRKLYIGNISGRTNWGILRQVIYQNRDVLCSLKIASSDEKEELQLETLPPLTHLEKLHLVGRLTRLPQWLLSLNCLHMLCLANCLLMDDPLMSFRNSPSLVSLDLFNAYKGSRMDCGWAGFATLRHLRIASMDQLERVDGIGPEVMPMLQCLSIIDCPRLERLPQLQNLSNIQSLEIMEMPETFMEKALTEDHQNIDHIPKITHVPQSEKAQDCNRKNELNLPDHLHFHLHQSYLSLL